MTDQQNALQRGQAGSSSWKTPNVGDLLPVHLRKELNSSNMAMIAQASLIDPQEIEAIAKVSVPQDKITQDPIVINCFSADTYSHEHHTLLMCYTINEIFAGVSTQDSDAVRIFLQALVLLFGRRALNSIRADQILDYAHLNLEIELLDPNNAETIAKITNDPETKACMQRLGVEEMPNPQVVMMAYCGAILLLAGKQLTEASLTAWTARRVRGLSASMGTSIEIASVVAFNLQAAVRVYQKLSMLVPLRAKMVRILFASTGTGSPLSSLSAAMLNLLAWSEMNHIRMIQDFLFGRFPELLAIKQLQGSSVGVLQTAWDYLESLDIRERPYAKLLYGPQQTKALQRDQFVLLTDAAHAVGSYLYSSFAHYQGDTQGTAGNAIKKIVREYLQNLEKTGALVVQATQYTTMDRRVVDNVSKADMLFKQQLNELDNDVQALMRE